MSIELLILFLVFFISHSVFLMIVLNNFNNAPLIFNLENKEKIDVKLSVLIPARNEEKNIGVLINSLQKQSFPIEEIIVLDDHSTDRTNQIIFEYKNKIENLKIIKGKELPSGWFGKNWACQQLSKEARGDVFLFLDADVELSEHAISNAVKKMIYRNFSMLSVFPSQKMNSLGEYLVVPLMNWLLLTFLSLRKIYKSKSAKFTAANGQFIMINKNSYESIGGHEAVKREVVEDMALARSIKEKGEKIITCLGDEAVKCRMYEGFDESVMGFSKNFYRGFNMPKPLFIILISLLAILFIAPIAAAFFNIMFVLILLMIAFERIFVSVISKQNWIINLLIHPIQMGIMFYVGIKSALASEIKWKGRSI